MIAISPALYILSLMSVFALPSNDLLDYVPTQSYWRIKHVVPNLADMRAELADPADATAGGLIDQLSSADPQTRAAARRSLAQLGRKALPALRDAIDGGDPETVSVAKELMAQIAAQSQPKEVRRLMAIRTLGESGDTAALPVLQPLLRSDELFEAEYAAAAIALLQHQPPATRPESAGADRASDAWALPANVAAVWQVEAHPGHPVLLDPILAQEAAGNTRDVIQELSDRLTQSLIAAAETAGNVRLETVTLALSGDIGPRGGFLMAVLRGKYDSVAALRSLALRRAPLETAAGMKVFGARGAWFFMPDSSRAVVIFGVDASQLETIVSAVTAGAKDLHDSPDLSPMLKNVDPTLPIWGVAKVTAMYRSAAPILAPFDSLRLEGKVKDQVLHISLSASGIDAAGAQASVNEFNNALSQVQSQARMALASQPMLAPVEKVVESIHCNVDGTGAAVSLDAPAALGEAILDAAKAAPAPAAPAP